MNRNRDNTLEEILKRYDKANRMAIVTSSRVVFDSLQDIPFLVALIKKLEQDIKNEQDES